MFFLLTTNAIFITYSCNKSENDVSVIPCVEEEYHEYQDSNFHIGIPGDMEFGVGSAQKLGADWASSLRVFAVNDTTLVFDFTTLPNSDKGRYIESLFIQSVDKREGCYSLMADNPEGPLAFYDLIEIDIGIGEYMLFQEDNLVNIIEITQLNGDSIRGSFAMSFLDTSEFAGSPGSEPEIIRFYNGSFEAVIQE